MEIVPGTLLIAVFAMCIYILQKWRRSIKESMSPFDDTKTRFKKNSIGYFADVFSLGFIFFIILIVYFIVEKNQYS